MSDQPLLTILEMEGEILEKGFSNNKDQIDNDHAEFVMIKWPATLTYWAVTRKPKWVFFTKILGCGKSCVLKFLFGSENFLSVNPPPFHLNVQQQDPPKSFFLTQIIRLPKSGKTLITQFLFYIFLLVLDCLEVPWQFVVGGAYKPILVFRLGFGQAVWSCMLGGIGWRVLGLLKVVWTHKTL